MVFAWILVINHCIFNRKYIYRCIFNILFIFFPQISHINIYIYEIDLPHMVLVSYLFLFFVCLFVSFSFPFFSLFCFNDNVKCNLMLKWTFKINNNNICLLYVQKKFIYLLQWWWLFCSVLFCCFCHCHCLSLCLCISFHFLLHCTWTTTLLELSVNVSMRINCIFKWVSPLLSVSFCFSLVLFHHNIDL